MKNKPNIEDFEHAMQVQNLNAYPKEKNRLKNRTIMNEGFLQEMVDRKLITEKTAEEIEQIIKDDSFLHEAYTANRLFISTATRTGVTEPLSSYKQDSREYIEKNNKGTEKEGEINGLEIRCKAMNDYYDPKQEFEPRLIDTFRAMQEYKPSNNLAQLHNKDALNAIRHYEMLAEGEEKKFGISIEIFPSISYEPGIGNTLGRFDSYNPTDNILKVCPNNLPDVRGIPTRSTPKSLFAHELAHAVDGIANKDNPSVKGLELTIRKYFPTIDATNVDKVRTALTNAAKLYDKDFNDCYGVERIIDKSYNLDFEIGGATDGAAGEFVSFFAQSVSECLNDLKEGKDFSTAYGEHIQGQIDKIYPPEDKLFAFDVMLNCSEKYTSKFIENEVQKLFTGVKEVIGNKIQELETAEKQLEGLTVTPSTPKASENEPNPTPAEDEAKNKVLQEFIEKIQRGEIKTVAINQNVDSRTEWDIKVEDSLNLAANEKNKTAVGRDRVLIIDKDNDEVISITKKRGREVIMFDEYLNQYLTPTEKEATPSNPPPAPADINKEAAPTDVSTTTTTTSTTTRSNQHLTRTEKENVTHFVPQGELNEKGKYNLNDRLAAVNDNQELLNKLDKEAAITANISFKAIDAKKSVEAEKTGSVKIRAEDSHTKEHGSNNQALIAEIQAGKINKNTVIAIERKQYGENQGMKDIIKIANILEHNEKNPDNPLKLPEKLENTLIFQDALLYKAAKENGIKVISLEGRNLEHTQDSAKGSALYNENREQYMTDVINEVRGKGYNVIANVGSSHVANLEKALENQQKREAGFSNISRKLRQEALNAAASVSKGAVRGASVNKNDTLRQQPLTNTQPKKSAQGIG